jgi:dephospho-CoA kinase
MTRCGLTGGIGSGKSLVCEIFRKLGLPVFYSDQEAKLLYLDAAVLNEVRNLLGEGVFNKGTIDFKCLATVVFQDKQALKALNGIIHPRVNAKYHAWLQQLRNAPASIMESALIFEAGLREQFDVVIDVHAPRELCMKRILDRDGLTAKEAEDRLNAQFDPELKRSQSDMVIDNDELTLLIPQVIDVFKKITGKSTI